MIKLLTMRQGMGALLAVLVVGLAMAPAVQAQGREATASPRLAQQGASSPSGVLAKERQPATATGPSNVYKQAMANFQRGHYQAALAGFSQLVKVWPRNSEVYRLRGITRYYLKNYSGALADANHAVQLAPRSTWAYWTRALAYAALAQQRQAIADYGQILRLNPKFWLAYYERGVSYMGLREYSAARADFTQAIHLVPTSADAYRLRSLMRYNLKNKSGAISDMRVAQKLYRTQGNKVGDHLASTFLKRLGA